MFYFNPRSYKRSDGLGHTVYDCTVEFQSTLLQEERRLLLQICIKNRRFQSTLLQEERHSNSAMFAIWYIFQSTLLQEERHHHFTTSKNKEGISIHAPTRGATTDSPFCFFVYIISIHAPTRGATTGLHQLFKQYIISIHAPTRGATSATYRATE